MWAAAHKWGEVYGKSSSVQSFFPGDSGTLGDLVSVEIFGTRYLFLNSYEAAIDLLEKRGNIYSGRPKAAMLDL